MLCECVASGGDCGGGLGGNLGGVAMVAVGIHGATDRALAIGETMTGGVDLLGVGIAAAGAGVGHEASLGAGSSLGNLGNMAMAGSAQNDGVVVTALGAGEDLGALALTAGSGGDDAVIVVMQALSSLIAQSQGAVSIDFQRDPDQGQVREAVRSRLC